MRIHAYSVAWNEEKFLPYYLKWYTSFCEKVTIFDNGSTDNSIDIINSFPNTEIITYDSKKRLDDNIHIKIKNNCWKESNADYVIIGDTDEILYHPNVLKYLEENKQYSIIESSAYEMVSQTYPTKKDFIHNIVKLGVPRTRNRIVNKKCIFDPKRIEEMNYCRGCHRSNPTGDVNILELEKSEIKFLHYKYLSEDYFVNRYMLYKNVRNPDNQYLHTLNKKILQDKFKAMWKRRLEIL